MISWGLISSAMMFVRGPWSFCTLRFLLGVAEAGFAPGVLLYLTYWVPARQQARATAWFLTATALAGVIGSPLAGLLLKLEGFHLFGHALHGWQWLFMLEGIPSVICGFIILFYLTNRPEQARWLGDDERRRLSDYIRAEHQQRSTKGHHSLLDGLTSGKVWLLNLTYCMLMLAFQGINYWMPQIIKRSTGASNAIVGLLAALPYLAAVVAMVVVGRHSDRTGERRWHSAISACVGAAGLLLCAAAHGPVLAMIALVIATAGTWSTLGPFWAMPPAFLGGTAAAAGIALVNSIGNLGGGLPGAWLMGKLYDRTHSHVIGLIIYASALMVAAGLAQFFGRFTRERAAA